MMTFKQVSKGFAYKYYGRQVAVGDGRRPWGKSLEQAQEEAGLPPGVWMGRALPAVGLVAGARVTDDQEELLAFYDFPAEHWIHLRTTNPIESTFSTVRLRTKVTRGAGSPAAALAMVFKPWPPPTQR